MTTGNNRLLRQAVRAAFFYSGTVAAALATHTSAAQTASTPAADQPETTPAMSEVVVTGSRISTPALASVSPITAVSSQEIRDSGVTRIEDLLNSLPQVVADQGSGLSMASTGVANVNLRGLGVQRTLVLVNGRRLMGGDPAAGAPSTTTLGYASAADINQIPVALVDRVDVLTPGSTPCSSRRVSPPSPAPTGTARLKTSPSSWDRTSPTARGTSKDIWAIGARRPSQRITAIIPPVC